MHEKTETDLDVSLVATLTIRTIKNCRIELTFIEEMCTYSD